MELTHINEKGHVKMVDVGEKETTARMAKAQAIVKMNPATLKLICEDKMPKGDVFSCARIAGIMAAKKTFELIPMCHNLPIDSVDIEIEPKGSDLVHIILYLNYFFHKKNYIYLVKEVEVVVHLFY